jgi:hypothetical protein
MQTNKQKKRLKRNTKAFRKALPTNESGSRDTFYDEQLRSHWKEINNRPSKKIGHK